MEEPHNVQVCAGCHQNLQLAANANVVSTGEFAMNDVLAVATAATGRRTPSRTSVACTWCGRSEDQARKLLSHGPAHICNACVALCADILQAELGDNWGD